MSELDEIDLKIASFMINEPRASYAELARGTGVTESTARRRFEALVKSGVLTPAVIPDIERLGFGSRAVLGLRVDLNYLNEVAERLRGLDEVTSLYMTMGRFDLILTVAEPSLDDLTCFMIREIAPLPGIQETESFVSIRTLKILRDWRLPADIEIDAPKRGIRSVSTE